MMGRAARVDVWRFAVASAALALVLVLASFTSRPNSMGPEPVGWNTYVAKVDEALAVRNVSVGDHRAHAAQAR